jgi:hypothetical protein
MSQQLVVLRGPNDWEQYKQKAQAAFQMQSAQINWGSGPERYPCLVACAPRDAYQLMSCYVYLDDALRLLKASGGVLDIAKVSGLPHDFFARPTPQPVDQQPNQLMTLGPMQTSMLPAQDFYRSVNAHLLAIVQELIEVKVTTHERYEGLYNKFLGLIDQWCTEDRAKLDLNPIQRAILEKLNPTRP